MLGLLFWLALVGGVVYLVLVLVRRGRSPDPDPDPGIGAPRRFYFYSISFIALMMLANGVMLIVMTLLDEVSGGPMLSKSTTKLASGLSLVVVGLPLWGIHWRFVQRTVSERSAERDMLLRKLYLYVTLAVALGFLVVNGYWVIEFLFRAGEFSGLALAAVLVWAVVWAYHWRVVTVEGPESTLETLGVRRLYLYLASAAGVAALAVGLGSALAVALSELYAAAFVDEFVSLSGRGVTGDPLRSLLAAAAVGGVVWWAHWIRFAREDRNSAIRWIYLFFATVGGGAIAVRIGLGLALALVFGWLFGASEGSTVEHFEDLPAALATIVAAAAVWSYSKHRTFVETDESSERTVARTYDLLLVAVGLAILAMAAASVINTALNLIIDGFSVTIGGEYPWRSQIALALTLLILGVPTWWPHWRRIVVAAAEDPVTERNALERKLYVLGVLCLGLLALVGGGASVIFIFLRDVLAADLSIDTARDLVLGLATVGTTALILPYHWTVYRQDREHEPEPAPEPALRKRVSLLTGPGGSEAVAEIESALGYSITAVDWTDQDAFAPELDAEDLAGIADEVASAPGAKVILIPEGPNLRVISYD